MKTTFIVILTFAFIGCKNKKDINIASDEIAKIQACKCYNNLDEEPIKTYTFSDQNSISVCGYIENDDFSEFAIFDCKTQKLIANYDAVQTCKLNFENDQLHIAEITKLPANDNWEWNDLQIAEEIITIKNGNVISLGSKPKTINISISEKAQLDFLNLLETENYRKLDIEEILARLEVLSISGNKRAKKKLYSIENDENYELDGAIAEQYKSAIASIEWREKNK